MRVVKNLGNGWSKSIFLEDKVVVNFNFRHGAKKSGHLDHPLQSYSQIYFNIFRYILRKAGLLWFTTSQGSLLFSKFEFPVMPNLRDLSFS